MSEVENKNKRELIVAQKGTVVGLINKYQSDMLQFSYGVKSNSSLIECADMLNEQLPHPNKWTIVGDEVVVDCFKRQGFNTRELNATDVVYYNKVTTLIDNHYNEHLKTLQMKEKLSAEK